MFDCVRIKHRCFGYCYDVSFYPVCLYFPADLNYPADDFDDYYYFYDYPC